MDFEGLNGGGGGSVGAPSFRSGGGGHLKIDFIGCSGGGSGCCVPLGILDSEVGNDA